MSGLPDGLNRQKKPKKEVLTDGNVEKNVTGLFQEQTAETVREIMLRTVTALPFTNSSRAVCLRTVCI